MNKVIRVLLEYSPAKNRVMVRGAFSENATNIPDKLSPENVQNLVSVFQDVDMGHNVGFVFSCEAPTRGGDGDDQK